MTPPEVAALRALRGAELGAVLGVFYVFLRPLRPRFTTLCDLAFLAGVGWAWLWLAFGVCGGDLRMGYLAAMALAALVCTYPAERLLGRIFRGFWAFWGRLWEKILLPPKNFLNFAKKLVASAKKWGKIKWNNRRHFRRASGGDSHGRTEKSLPRRQGGLHQEPPSDQAGGDRSHSRLYGIHDHPGPGGQPHEG